MVGKTTKKTAAKKPARGAGAPARRSASRSSTAPQGAGRPTKTPLTSVTSRLSTPAETESPDGNTASTSAGAVTAKVTKTTSRAKANTRASTKPGGKASSKPGGKAKASSVGARVTTEVVKPSRTRVQTNPLEPATSLMKAGAASAKDAEVGLSPVGWPDHEDVAKRAYEIYVSAGYPDGKHEDHWLQAEYELRTQKHINH